MVRGDVHIEFSHIGKFSSLACFYYRGPPFLSEGIRGEEEMSLLSLTTIPMEQPKQMQPKLSNQWSNNMAFMNVDKGQQLYSL